MNRRKKSNPKRGDVYLVNFDPALGAEVKKTRPALIVQNDIANRYSPVTIVAAITSQFDESLYPTEVPIKNGEAGLHQNSVALLNQVRSIDTERLMQRLGSINKVTMQKVNHALKISLGLVEI